MSDVTNDIVRQVIEDPRHRFAAPPFSSELQSRPGYNSAMNPRPDHGEHSYRGAGRLDGLTAIVTGGDSGIGRAVALAYAREGANVVFTYLEEDEDAAETEWLVKDAGRRTLPIKMDQSSSAACDDVVEQCFDQFGRLDVIVNNAAYQKTFENIEDMTDEEIQHTFNTNLFPHFYFARRALQQMTAGGSIINTTSIQAYSPGFYLRHL